jgi:hypothetical protein
MYESYDEEELMVNKVFMEYLDSKQKLCEDILNDELNGRKWPDYSSAFKYQIKIEVIKEIRETYLELDRRNNE